MICSHCGKALGNEKLMFCVYCGYPLKGDKKGFFAKSDETGVSRAEKMANDAPAAGKPAAEHPQPAPMQNAQQIPQTNTVPPTGNVQGMGMPSPMGMQQPMQGMPGGMGQGMVPGMPGGMPQMGYGMPQMGYGMPPQMQYGVPQFAGYDAAGNPLYMQMVPQLVGYDAYGNPVYNMVAMPYVMPTVQGMPGMPPMMQQQPIYPQEQVIDVPQEQIRPAEPVAPAQNAQIPMQKAPVKHTAPPPQTLQSIPFQKPAAPQPAAPAPAPIQSVQAATQAAMEALTAFQGVSVVQDAQPVPPSPYRSAQINSVYDLPMDADALINEDEKGQSAMPDEKALLDSIFSDKQKNYSMTEGAKPGSATFSINVGLHEIRNAKEEEFGGAQTAPPPAQSLYSKPSGFVNPFIDPGYTNPESEEASAPAPAPKPAAKKPSKPMTEKDANAAKRAAKEAKMREKEAAEAAKSGKAPKASKDKKGQKKPPARIVSPDEFFEDKPHNGTRSRSMLSVKELDKLDDGQLEAHLSSLGGSTGGKKSNRSMKAATKEKMDISNIDPDALVGAGKRRLPN